MSHEVEKKYDQETQRDSDEEANGPQPAAPREWLKRKRADNVCSGCDKDWVESRCYDVQWRHFMRQLYFNVSMFL